MSNLKLKLIKLMLMLMSLFFFTMPCMSIIVFTFPVHWPGLGVDLGLNYCHPLLTTTGPDWVWDLGLDHWHQPLSVPGSLMKQKQTSLFKNLLVTST